MIPAKTFIQATQSLGFGLYTGVPCSYLTSFINYVIDDPALCYVGAANEGDAVAIASGAELAGVPSIAMFQNSGLGNAVNPLTSLNQIFKIPILMIVTWRGQPDGAKDEPQHQMMGEITPQLLELMQIPWEYFPTEVDEIQPTLKRAVQIMRIEQKPYALVMKKGSIETCSLNSSLKVKSYSLTANTAELEGEASFSRHEILKNIQNYISSNDILLATTGYCGRELYSIADNASQFYMVGSMGCVSSLGLGIAISKPQQRVIVLDGDGAALMRLGALATIGYERPANLLHILLDNQCHESTGGQSTVSHSINFSAIASACGYQKVACIYTPEELKNYLKSPSKELTFLHIKIKPGIPEQLPRPKITPPEVAQRLREFLQNK
ncbi:phosphonopyruvate decarboxylase [Tolypothrix sp. PCC 7910]|uniref:phosphonopyruvate decarboxylase n=1 Tax=Tolypothrix sp. PCC 7910 TaxID=2099387 RepID=UPI0014277E8A|nr:phosphonopyruvate decarboxylase [Tolypothrix sp. PCC 7910]QIR39095.1 phosphonopyruvate decarboxylase [Tolypothrix sp. PCC 7910]